MHIMKNKLFKKGDVAVILAVLVAAAAFWLLTSRQNDKLEAVITVDGEVIETIDLATVNQKRLIKLNTEPKVVVAVENGAIYFEESACEDKLCVNCGKLSRKGDTAVCLPAKTVVTVSGSDVDVMTW